MKSPYQRRKAANMSTQNAIQSTLFEYQDLTYADFQSSLIPTLPREFFIGVRVPNVRKIAKDLVKTGTYESFLCDLPHRYYDENMLHSAILTEIKDYDKCIEYLDRFLPFVDNWAVCDTLRPKTFARNKDKLMIKIKEWSFSPDTYTCRFGIQMLMNFFLDDDFKPEYLEIPVAVHSDEYYVKMMVAWFFATALAKQWDATIPYLTQNRLEDAWIHNKTIQKARESYRISPSLKDYLKSLKR